MMRDAPANPTAAAPPPPPGVGEPRQRSRAKADAPTHADAADIARPASDDPIARTLPRYALAIASVAVMAAVWGWLPRVGLEYQQPFLLFTMAVVVSGWFCGFGPTLLATAISAYLIELLFLRHVGPPVVAGGWDRWVTPVAMLLFVVQGGVIGLLGEGRLRYRRSLERASRTFDERVSHRTLTLRGAVDRLQAEVFQRQAAEEGLLQSNADLRAIEAELRELTARLRQSNSELEEFASVASHDLQEPLRKIRAFGDRLASKSRDQLDDASRDYLDRMLHAAERMSILINDLLAFSRVTTQGQAFRPVDLKEVVRGVLADLESAIESSQAEVEAGDLPTLDADPLQMRQLLQNLIGNAIKFHREGVPPRVTVAATPCEPPAHDVEVDPVRSVDGEGGWVRLTVSDNGIGFDTKYLDRIFEVFQRLHGRSTYAGTGIGLAVCRKIARRHGGTITATSVEGEGATFIVSLPRHHFSDDPPTVTDNDPRTGDRDR